MTDILNEILIFYSQNGLVILYGFLITIVLCVAGIIGSAILGIFIYLVSVPENKATRKFYKLLIYILRGTPLLVLLFLIYYGGPRIGIVLSAYASGICGLTIYGAPYFAEIYRAGFQSIPAGQIEAAKAVGLSRTDTTIRIKIPQMLALIIPSMFNQAIVLVKESAVLSIITVPELTSAVMGIVNEKYIYVQPFVAAGILYWLFNEFISRTEYAVDRGVRNIFFGGKNI